MAQPPVPYTAEYWANMSEWSAYLDTNLQAKGIFTPVTISNSSPAVVHSVGHSLTAGSMIVFTTTGTLPTGIDATKYHYVIAAGLGPDDFEFSTSYGGAPVNTSSAGSGVHTVYNEDWGLFQTYYDYTMGQYRLADHFADTATYYPRATIGAKFYQDLYVNFISPPGQVQGYRCFIDGLVERYTRTGDVNAKTAIQNILANNPYCTITNTSDDLLSRECAYALHALTKVHDIPSIVLTPTQLTWRSQLFEWALGHIDQWCVAMTADYYRPFMGGITAYSLYMYYMTIAHDPRIIPALETLATYTWNTCWMSADKAFSYTDRGGFDPEDLNPQPDLNMVIAPLYGWLWYKTGVADWKTKGNLIFEGGVSVYSGAAYVSGSYLGSRSAANPAGKQYNQQLIWGPYYIDWAESDPEIDIPGEEPDPDPDPDPEPDPQPPGTCLGGETLSVTYKSYANLSCKCEETGVIICVSTSLTCNSAPFIEGTLVSTTSSLNVCNCRLYSYYISYDSAQLLDPTIPLTSCDITGVVCRGCLTQYIDWKAPFYKTSPGASYTFVLPQTTPVPGAYLIVDSVDGKVITLAWGPPT